MELSHQVSELDAILALAITALERDWVKPTINDKSPIEIDAGRHPLQELTTTSFVPNSTYMGERMEEVAGDGKITVLTGPNACGKSIYLKQVGLITFLAHLGSFVPAEAANLPLINAIYSRIHTMDSIEVGLSTFALDLNQMSVALRCAGKSSLVLIDEFGKGTSQSDGLGLLASALDFWANKGADSPFVVVSTHFLTIQSVLPRDNRVLSFKTFAHEIHEEEVVQLFHLINGVGVTSEALRVAAHCGIKPATIQRAQTVLRCITSGCPIPPNWSSYPPLKDVVDICDIFLDIDFDDEKDFKDRIKQIVEKIRPLEF